MDQLQTRFKRGLVLRLQMAKSHRVAEGLICPYIATPDSWRRAETSRKKRSAAKSATPVGRLLSPPNF
jgi:hypothetical protein